MEYVTEYASNAKNDQIHKLATALGLDENLLRDMMTKHLRENNINEFGRFDALKSTVNIKLAKSYYESKSGMELSIPKVNIKIGNTLRDFILNGGGDF